MTVTELPRPDTGGGRDSRWIPCRAGILNVWRYYDEVFEFHEGRLLLRGPNGSGKSKALELLLPYLFDANLRANRLSTFGTGERTMHWNMMEGATGTTRVGYVWLEFRSPDDQWFTCGARLQASTHTTTVHPDYFTTDLRIGDGLMLTTEGRPLTRAALEELLGGRGTIYGTGSDYRDAIRSTLFPTLNEQRYDALITALLQLRTPKLSQRLDPSLLSTLLSRALPPLGQEEIADLAEGFERLDAQRERLTRLEDEVAATRALARQQKTYAQRVLRAGAAALISATSELDKLSSTAKKSAEEYETVAQLRIEKGAAIETLADSHAEAEARKEGLMESEAYKQGQQLDGLRRQETETRGRAERIRGDADQLRTVAAADESEHRDAAAAEQRQEQEVSVRVSAARQTGLRAGLISVFEEIAADTDGSRSLLRGAVRGKRDQLAAIGKALDQHERAIERREEAEGEIESARMAFAEAEEGRVCAIERREYAHAELGARVRSWATGCHELVFADPDALVDLAESESDLLEAVNTVASAVFQDITRETALCESALKSGRLTRDELVAERDRRSGEPDIPPAVPFWRTADRTRMSGAPLWRLVDFADAVPEPVQASVEAALEAAGLLDAWIGPQGQIEGHEVFAEPGVLAAVPGRSLLEVLIPLPDIEIDPAVVQRLLETIGYGEQLPDDTVAAIGADGSWRIGNLTGSWHKDQPAYIGALTRERARQRRIHELNDQIARYDQILARLDEEQSSLDSRRLRLEGELASRADHADLSEAQRLLTRAESDLAAADGVVRRKLEGLSVREYAVKEALRELSSLAAENGMPSERTALATLSEAFDTFSDHAENWLDAVALLRSARAFSGQLAEQARRSTELAEQREMDAATTESDLRQISTKLEAIESAIGRDYREVLNEIADLRTRITDLDRQLGEARKKVIELTEQLGKLDSQRATDAQARDIAATNRDTVAHRFRRLATGIFPADSEIPDLEAFQQTLTGSEGVRAALDSARLVAAAWPTIPHAPANLGEALRRLSESVHECRAALSSRADLDLETDEDIQVFTAIVDGIRVGAADLLRILRTEAEQSKHDITEQERQLFDKTLTGDTRRHLAARIRQANELVDGMNARLERVRTASNVSVRLVWQVAADLPTGTKAARDLLLKDPVRLTEADHESLHRFLRDRIEEAKADGTATSWEQQLSQVFDYTAWHRFVVKVDRGNGDGWQLLTKKLHGALSGGEKAIALHLPLFAAVAAHYQAAPEAPRVILLDEVFVGVDTTNRGQIFALLSALDLDLVLTSDHEWCTYSELSGIAIHQILTGDGDDAVTTARFTWNGQKLLSN
ncbi:TIGR02680 family protein [Nocardia australiensis]|uniref:TIGR02680 family protein n=1 Tax=Nocardia australiensis TaxID=2887191 RepID=UPI001D152310|nr:TIGR02680 family protein [Nocardia australiensis]